MSVAFDIIGGLGLFLLGIMLFMDSLRFIAGDAMRRGILRFAGTPIKAMFTGLVTTTFIQSAHATIVIAMGLAGAGILSSAQSLAILIGANIGTTGTAWLVALLGLRFGFGPVAVIMVAAGAFARLVSRSRIGVWGQVIAGFGLLFVGIDQLAAGMSGLNTGLDGFSSNGGFTAILALIGIGVVSTIIAQSSSVTVAATIAAVFAGVLRLEDAAWLVVGQNIGTTSTLLLVSIGAAPSGRRLAAAHVLINGSTAILVMIAFRPILWLVSTVIHGLGGDDALAVAGFHTTFNLLGAAIWMPLIIPLTRRLERWIPDRGPRLTGALGPLTARVPGVGLEAARRTLSDIAAETCGVLRSRLEHGALPSGSRVRLEAVDRAMLELRDYLAKVQGGPVGSESHRLHMHVVNATERLDHIVEACQRGKLTKAALRSPRLAATYERLVTALSNAQVWLAGTEHAPIEELLESLKAVELRKDVDHDALLEATAMGDLLLPNAMGELEASAWMSRQAHYMRRLIPLLVKPNGTVPLAEATGGEPSAPAALFE